MDPVIDKIPPLPPGYTLDVKTARNPTTGARAIKLGAGAWQPLEASATNPQTGERTFKVNGRWLPPLPKGYSLDQPQSARAVDDQPSALANFASAAVRPLAKGVAALPLMAMDAGVATRNLVGDAANKALGRPATPDYELPSSMFNRALDSVTVAPQTTAGRVAEVISNTLAGARLGVPDVPAVARAVKPEVAAARAAGLTVPPTAGGGGFLSQLAEGFGGKLKTQQLASLKNSPRLNALVQGDINGDLSTLGAPQAQLPAGPITVDALKRVRSVAGKAYAAVKSVRDIPTDDAYQRDIAALGRKYGVAGQAFGRTAEHPVNSLVGRLSAVKDFDGDEAVNEIQLLRDEAEKAAAQRDRGLSAAYRDAAGAIEDQVERHLASDEPALVGNFRKARQLIAKTYSVQSALDKGTGDVNVAKLVSQLNADKPLSGGIRKVAEFGAAFPKAAQLPSKVGSVTQYSPLDLVAAGLDLSGLSAAIASGSPKAAAAAAVALAGQASRPALRAALLSKTGQRLAIEGAPVAKVAAKRVTNAALQQIASAQDTEARAASNARRAQRTPNTLADLEAAQ